MTKTDGGPAFPTIETTLSNLGGQQYTAYVPVHGMSLRDWFAGQALMGMFSSNQWYTGQGSDAAKWAYHHADAMLAEREKGE